MIVKCMRPQNPNFSEEKMGQISAKKSIKTMVPYNGHALVEGSVLVGRTIFRKAPVKVLFCYVNQTFLLVQFLKIFNLTFFVKLMDFFERNLRKSSFC